MIESILAVAGASVEAYDEVSIYDVSFFIFCICFPPPSLYRPDNVLVVFGSSVHLPSVKTPGIWFRIAILQHRVPYPYL